MSTGTWTRQDADRMVKAARRMLAAAKDEYAPAELIAHLEQRLAEAIEVQSRY